MAEGDTPIGANDMPAPGDWPCQVVVPDPDGLPPRLVTFLYRLLRDGAATPAVVEGHAIHATRAGPNPSLTNGHLAGYAQSLASYLMRDSGLG